MIVNLSLLIWRQPDSVIVWSLQKYFMNEGKLNNFIEIYINSYKVYNWRIFSYFWKAYAYYRKNIYKLINWNSTCLQEANELWLCSIFVTINTSWDIFTTITSNKDKGVFRYNKMLLLDGWGRHNLARLVNCFCC